MNLLRRIRRWVSAHDPASEERITQAILAGREVEAEAKRLHRELDRIKKTPDPLGELVKSMRMNGHS